MLERAFAVDDLIQEDENKSELLIRVDSFADLVTVPCSVRDRIWEKVLDLTTDSNAIASAPDYDKGHTVDFLRQMTTPCDVEK